MYTEDHPTVSSLRQNIATVSSDSSQLMSLRAEVQGLEREQDELLAETEPSRTPSPAVGSDPQSPSPDPAATRAAEAVPVAAVPDMSALGVSSDYTSPTSLRFRLELGQLAEIRERLESARIQAGHLAGRFQVSLRHRSSDPDASRADEAEPGR